MTRISGVHDNPDGPHEVAVDVAFAGITVDEIGRVMGYTETVLPDYFADGIARILADLERTCRVRAGYRIVQIDRRAVRSDVLNIGGIRFTSGRSVAAQMHDAEAAAFFACTIGSQMEERAAARFREGDPVTGHFIDTVTSVAVERAADALHDAIARRMRECGLGVTNRFSPGYCGWPVAQQHELFSFFPDKFCGITLTDSALMLPKKSVSGMIGIGLQAKREPYPCDRCTNSECTYKIFLSTRNTEKDGVR
jgi:hypothetical protein